MAQELRLPGTYAPGRLCTGGVGSAFRTEPTVRTGEAKPDAKPGPGRGRDLREGDAQRWRLRERQSWQPQGHRWCQSQHKIAGVAGHEPRAGMRRGWTRVESGRG